MTVAQNAILQAVREQMHPTADAVYAEVKKEIPSIALGTVYRNLSQFAEKNAIRRIPRSNAPDFFDGKTDTHDHIICIECGKVSDLCLPGLIDVVNAYTKTEVLSVELSASHICLDCRNSSD